jgi:hypothetical protein
LVVSFLVVRFAIFVFAFAFEHCIFDFDLLDGITVFDLFVISNPKVEGNVHSGLLGFSFNIAGRALEVDGVAGFEQVGHVR